MIFHNTEDTGLVASSGMGDTSVARIATTAHMFGILSSRLYSDKVAAVLREIGCNALDAHTDAGTPERPFEVKLPNHLDKTFHIRDWGLGLDEDQVRNLYMTYGESTKQGSNKFVGAMGLGSKSPFAYTHTFTIVAVKDGVKRYFTAYLNEAKVPVITKTHETESDADWPSGLMVTFPVPESDFDEFKRKAQAIYGWFGVAPTVLGLAPEEAPAYPEFGMALAGRYGFAAKTSGFTSPAVVMGNIRYPLDVSKVIDRYPEHRELLSVASAKGVHLFVAIGEVMFTPNREALEYDRRSLELIRDRLLEVIRHIGETLVERVRRTEATTVEYLRKLKAVQTEFRSTGLLERSTLQAVMALCGISKEEAESVPALHSDLHIKAPLAVSSRRLAKASELPNAEEDDKDDEDEDDKGAVRPDSHSLDGIDVYLVQRYETKNKTVRVRSRPVWNGTVFEKASSQTGVPIALDPALRVSVFHLEGAKDGKAKVQALVVSGELDAAILCVPSGDASEDDVQEHAEFIAGPQGFDGYPVVSTKSLNLPKEQVRMLLHRRKSHRLTLEDKLRRTRVYLVSAGHYPEESTLFDALQTGHRNYMSFEDRWSDHGTDLVSIGQTVRLQVLRTALRGDALKTLAKASGDVAPVSEVIAIREGSLRKFDAAELELVPFLQRVQGWLRDERICQALSSEADDYNEVAEALNSGGWRAPLKRLASWRASCPQAAATFDTRYEGTDILKALEVAREHEGTDSSDTTAPVTRALMSLETQGILASESRALLERRVSSRALLLKAVAKKLEPLRALDMEHLGQLGQSHQEPEVALAFLDLAMMLSGFVPVRALREQLRAATA